MNLTRTLLVCVAIISLLTIGVLAEESEHRPLSESEVVGISLASGGIYGLGRLARAIDTTRTPLIKGALPLEEGLHRLLGGEYRPGQSNFLDHSKGSAATPITSCAILLVADLAYPVDDNRERPLQDLFLMSTGLLATKGVTDLAKGIVSRPRPYLTVPPAELRLERGFREDRSSFCSGHASSAFFSATFLNLRLRSIMRAEMSSDDFDSWGWLSPTVTFGWASFVGLSRVQAYKHYLSDILAGALVGYLTAEIFYSLGNRAAKSSGTNSRTPMMIRFSFAL